MKGKNQLEKKRKERLGKEYEAISEGQIAEKERQPKGSLTITLVGENTFSNIPNDAENIISDVNDSILLLEAIAAINPNITNSILSVLDAKKTALLMLDDEGKKEAVISSAKILTRKALLDIALGANKGINTEDVKLILEGIKKHFPEVRLPKLTKKSKPRISNKAFKLSTIEPTPNHFTCTDILTLLIKPLEFTAKADYVQTTKNHQNKKVRGYTALKIPKPEKVKIGDFSFTVLKCFDWKDRKILRLIFTEAVHHKETFPISLKWVLEQIGELKTGGKTLNEKLEDLKSRFIRYRNVILNWEYRSGKKIDESEGGIFILNWGSYYTKPNDIIIEDLFLGKWFQINKDIIKEFTRIPQKLISINTTYHWIGYAIAEKMCILLRINKEDILAKKSAYRVPIKLSIKSLLDEILIELEIREALAEKLKGSRLKLRILDEIKFLESHLGWQFELIGVKDNQSFKDFYSSTSFICHVDPELESQILGEKQIKEIKPKSKIPLTIEGDLVKALRKNLKMTQETLAKYLGYDRTLISKIERGSEIASEEFINNLYQKFTSEIEKIKK
ncbi:helix-turn-helix transcriptional regulator [Cyanobacterium sp. Dongsha4]|uniref:helix-turn-helix domain-containing protein n=1 Tax=Cyanobacterium sp. DS4 TaxID=2878255 RepID=UPI002E7FD630|nr:helix-turn-helix transcriptional regulator [Cyanobacterium sp. Dongsha4]WVL02509.1 helix-turn-helix domain-containing protein [Cyanobacterium sp. Dongsha4]